MSYSGSSLDLGRGTGLFDDPHHGPHSHSLHGHHPHGHGHHDSLHHFGLSHTSHHFDPIAALEPGLPLASSTIASPTLPTAAGAKAGSAVVSQSNSSQQSSTSNQPPSQLPVKRETAPIASQPSPPIIPSQAQQAPLQSAPQSQSTSPYGASTANFGGPNSAFDPKKQNANTQPAASSQTLQTVGTQQPPLSHSPNPMMGTGRPKGRPKGSKTRVRSVTEGKNNPIDVLCVHPASIRPMNLTNNGKKRGRPLGSKDKNPRTKKRSKDGSDRESLNGSVINTTMPPSGQQAGSQSSPKSKDLHTSHNSTVDDNHSHSHALSDSAPSLSVHGVGHGHSHHSSLGHSLSHSHGHGLNEGNLHPHPHSAFHTPQPSLNSIHGF